MSLDQDKMNEFVAKFVNDVGAVAHGVTILIGERLGLYKAMGAAGPVSPKELAQNTGTSERYIREWLAAQAASGYVSFDPRNGKYFLTPEQAFALTNEGGPMYVPGVFQIAAAIYKDEPKITEAFRTGKGIGWHEHHPDLFEGTQKFFRPNYVGNLVSSWLPALDGMLQKLEKGAHVADVGCGYGASTILMAKTYPKSTFIGYDYHPASIEQARKIAERDGLSNNLKFEIASAKGYPGKDFDMVGFFDCLHDMGDPVGAATHVRESLKPDGTWMIVEPFANEEMIQNFNPVGRIFYSASTCVCTPSSLAQEVGLALGAQASDTQLRDVVLSGGFKTFRRAAETPFNRVFEARL
ncbi:MAG TPA: methyltransferase domain-containing protein [Terriglobales bacterium]|nr:methyltransferase domain-containing protein [Terriglobales bacterium]